MRIHRMILDGRRPATAVFLPLLLVAAVLAPSTTAQEAEGPTEKDLVSDFAKAFRSKDAPTRAAAITALGDLSRSLEDGGTSKRIAKELAKGLDDDELEVRAAAIGQLAWGRHVDTVIGAFKSGLDDLQKEVDKRITNPDEEAQAFVARGTRLYGDACMALANYKDDRSAEILGSQLKNLRRNTENNNLSTRLVGRSAQALLDIGGREGVEIAVKQMQVYNGQYQGQASRNLHQQLAEFAVRVGKAPPEWTENVAVDWHNWFEDNEELFPKKIGKLKEPPPERPYVDPRMERGRRDGGPERP
ncbi:MAG: HEAT repeat domain-containing protein [Planctomycetota bacterium]|jgi:hypothetical protein